MKDIFKRVSICLSDVDPFYKATFTTKISRIRFNRELAKRFQRRRTHLLFV